MSHERLWAPWRMAYIQGQAKPQGTDPATLRFLPGADAGCFLCCDVADSADRANLIVHRGSRSLVVLNRYPYNNGHLLIAPNLHPLDWTSWMPRPRPKSVRSWRG